MKKTSLILIIVFLSLNVFSKTKKKNNSGKKKTHVLNFEDDLFQGNVQKPDLIHLLDRKKYKFKKLIRLRDDFLPEMRRTAEDIKSGSGD